MKSAIRKKTLQVRDSLSASLRAKFSKLIVKKILNLNEFQKAETVLLYFAFGSEVETINLIKKSVETKTTLLPLVLEKEKRMIACEIQNLEKDIKPGFRGIFEPQTFCRKSVQNEIDLVIVPGITFGVKGERLGYGGGFYDKFLANFKGKIIGICFENQLSDKIILEKDDIKMQKIITEKRIIDCLQ